MINSTRLKEIRLNNFVPVYGKRMRIAQKVIFGDGGDHIMLFTLLWFRKRIWQHNMGFLGRGRGGIHASSRKSNSDESGGSKRDQHGGSGYRSSRDHSSHSSSRGDGHKKRDRSRSPLKTQVYSSFVMIKHYSIVLVILEIMWMTPHCYKTNGWQTQIKSESKPWKDLYLPA